MAADETPIIQQKMNTLLQKANYTWDTHLEQWNAEILRSETNVPDFRQGPSHADKFWLVS
jgi:hypothetical protein